MRVLYLDLDTLRPDHLGCYGYARNTSPNIDSIAEKATRFNNCYCSDAPCLPARTAIMSGRFGIHTGVVGHGGTAADHRIDGPPRLFHSALSGDCLPRLFRENGYHTCSISPFAERHSAWWYTAGFSEIHNTGSCGMESAEQVTPTVLKWIGDHATEDNWLLHINYWDAHTPYRAPEAFGKPFENVPLCDDWITEEIFAEHLRKCGPHSANELAMFTDQAHYTKPNYPRAAGSLKTLADVKEYIDEYDTGIAYMDSHIGMIIAALQKAGVYDDLAIVITSDHAENQGELGIYGEHATADHINCHIPMIVRWPGCEPGTNDGLLYTLDLAPTFAELMGREPRKNWDGISFAPAVRGEAWAGRPYLVVGQCAHTCQRGVRFGNWHYIRTYHCGYHLFPQEMLFNIADDPHETCDVAIDNPNICLQAVHLLSEWHDEMMQTSPSDTDPLWTVMREGGPHHCKEGNLPAYLQRLEQTGRADKAAILRAKYAKP